LDDLVVIVIVHDEAFWLVVAEITQGGEVRDIATADVDVPVNFVGGLVDASSFLVEVSVNIRTPGPVGPDLLLNLDKLVVGTSGGTLAVAERSGHD